MTNVTSIEGGSNEITRAFNGRESRSMDIAEEGGDKVNVDVIPVVGE
jgi:hypothetical protein